MKRRNLVIATILSLSVVMLTACGGSEEGKETTTKQKTEVESSITVADKHTTVIEKDTTGEQTTTGHIIVENEQDKKYQADIEKFNHIVVAMMDLMNDNERDVYKGGEESLDVMIGLDNDASTLSHIEKVFSWEKDFMGREVLTFNAESDVFKGITVDEIYVVIENGQVSVLVPVNKTYEKDYEAYIVGNHEWSKSAIRDIERRKYNADMIKFDGIKTALSCFVIDGKDEFIDGKEYTLTEIFELDSQNIVKGICEDIFYIANNSKLILDAYSNVFKDITLDNVYVCIENGAISIYIAVNEQYSDDYEPYVLGLHKWN